MTRQQIMENEIACWIEECGLRAVLVACRQYCEARAEGSQRTGNPLIAAQWADDGHRLAFIIPQVHTGKE